MVTYLRIIVLLAIVLFNRPVSGADVSTPSAPDVTFGVSGDVRTFLDNIEYSTSYQTGETIFGASAAFRFFFKPSVHTQFAFGVYGLRLFGDESFFTRTLPLFRAQYESERVSFILGEIISCDAHGLPDIAYRQEFRFDPGIEEGIQVRVRLKHFKEDLWVAWDSLNTPAQREHFTAGSAAFFSIAHCTFPFLLTVNHTGGELYDIQEQPVQEHFGGVTGVTVDFPLDAGIRRVFGEILIAGSAYRVRSTGNEAGQGYGIAGKAGISPLGFDCSLQWFKGHDLLMPVGDPVYQTNRPVFALEMARNYSVNDQVSLTGGLRFETVETSFSSYIRSPQYRFWIALCGGFERKFEK
ncbi:MAG: hypothetical protein ABSF80_07225 [Chitinispirillaceae bacterium]|jgi:outer membrane receptor protein involved in Fe transport